MIPDFHTDSRLRLPLVRNRTEFILELARQADTIAHLGCTDAPYTEDRIANGELLHASLLEQGTTLGSSVVGFDIDAAGIEELRRLFPDSTYLCCPFPEGIDPSDQGRYDLVIAGEVIEHVPNIGAFLEGCTRLLAPEGRLCLTVPNACSPKIGVRALVGREVVHPDHWTYFGPRTLEHCLTSTGMSIEQMSTYLAEPGPLGRGFNHILRIAHRLRRGPVGDGLIAVATANRSPVSCPT